MKPCTDCPGVVINMPSPQQVVVPGAAYVDNISLVARALPPELNCIGHDDGSLEFTQEVPDIAGYAREGRVFRPLWPECLDRMFGVTTAPIKVSGRCQGFGAEHFTRLVTVDQCRECPARRTNPIPKPLLRTAEEFIAEAEAKAVETLKARLGEDIFERAAANLVAWARGRTANSTSRDAPPERSAT